jgi:hypothetical protein
MAATLYPTEDGSELIRLVQAEIAAIKSSQGEDNRRRAPLSDHLLERKKAKSKGDVPGSGALHPVFLILDGELNHYPWESMGFLVDRQSICRMPNVACIAEERW